MAGLKWLNDSRLLLAALAAAFLLQFTLIAEAAAKKAEPVLGDIDRPMQFVIVRSSTPACEPLCPEWIWARGEITAATPKAFKRFLKKIGKKRLPVLVSSPGGSVDAAMAIGRLIRERKLDTGVGTAYLTGCAPTEKDCLAKQKKSGVYNGRITLGGAFCNSACPLILAGGVNRIAGSAFVGVHQITTTYYQEKIFYREKYKVVKGKKKVVSKKIVSRKRVGTYNSTDLPKALERQMLAYLKEMGIDKTYFTISQGVPAKDIRQLGPGEMSAMKLTTVSDHAYVFAGLGRCTQHQLSENCIEDLDRAVSTKEPVPAVVSSKTPARVVAPPMRFAVVRSSETGCEPMCPGAISAEAPVLLAQILQGLGGRRLPIVLRSPGGDADAAMALGRVIRQHGLAVALGKTTFSGCGPGEADCHAGEGKEGQFLGRAGQYQNYCASECALVMAGGTRRFATEESLVILRYKGPEPDPALKQRLAEYLIEMGVEKMLLTVALGPVGSDFDPPTLAQMYRMKLATDTRDVDTLTAANTCAVLSGPDSCSSPRTQNGL
ncbi:hypothetical protein [Neomesorhizobium albiziae]|uniref:hypothetical protein n=1 Tax=Neomesorhizobium albiziae TaxID=335020 RepID=UPI00122D42A3|nr:hypothetical protein [Mesorhizobium albiziae]